MRCWMMYGSIIKDVVVFPHSQENLYDIRGLKAAKQLTA